MATTAAPHIAMIPSAGIGHMTPILRLASVLLSRNCLVTLVTARPIVSMAESKLISKFLQENPEIKHIEFDVIPFCPDNSIVDDPFFRQYISIARSSHLLGSVLSSPLIPFSAIICDLLVAKTVADIANNLCIPFYVVCTSSARFLCFALHLPTLVANADKISRNEEVEIPGLGMQSVSNLPLLFLNREFSETLFLPNLVAFQKAKRILLSSFKWFESETLDALNNMRVSSGCSPVLPIGPLSDFEFEKLNKSQYAQWLDNQPVESVVYVNFGSRNAMSKDQILEIRNGLEKSGYRFFWVLKTNKVDRDDKEDLKSLLGDSFLERTRRHGTVIKDWVNQSEVLAHPSIGLFISHCGWNSVIEAAAHAVPVLAWPLMGDQRLNADVVENAGLGRIDRTWGMGNDRLVKEEEIATKIKELMEDAELRSRAKKVGEEAKKAINIGGTSDEVIMKEIQSLS